MEDSPPDSYCTKEYFICSGYSLWMDTCALCLWHEFLNKSCPFILERRNSVPRHNEIRNFTAKLLIEVPVCTDVCTIVPVQFSDWAAPIVPVTKFDGTIRICGDNSVTVNAVSKLDQYPLPKIDDQFTAMSGGLLFTKLELSHAYQQLRGIQEVYHNQHDYLNTSASLSFNKRWITCFGTYQEW